MTDDRHSAVRPSSTIDWDVSGSYGESSQVQEIQNYALTSRLRQGSLVSLVGGIPTCHDASTRVRTRRRDNVGVRQCS